MSKIRTIEKAFEEIRQRDPNTCLTKFRIRQLIIDGSIPFKKAGTKYLFDLDKLEQYLRGEGVIS